MAHWEDFTTFGLRHWKEPAVSRWTNLPVTITHPTLDEVRAALPLEIRGYYEAAHTLTHAERGDEWGMEYGSWPGMDPREWCPDLESNTEAEIRHWAAACALYDQGDALRHEPTYPHHPLGCTRDERFGVGVWWRRLSDEERTEFAEMVGEP